MNAPESTSNRYCLLIPTYNNPETLRSVVVSGREYVRDVIVIDDGSSSAGRQVATALGLEGLATVHHRPQNGGKGAAVKTGFRVARELGFTHALQVDADSQHDLSGIPLFMQLSKKNPAALILGYPEYSESAPRGRRIARKVTDFWVGVEVGFGVIRDAMIGFRVYPLEDISKFETWGDRMDFDVEVAVRSAWAQIPILNAPVRVRYLDASEGGVSHFQPLRDTLRLSLMHSKLCTLLSVAFCLRLLGLRSWSFRVLFYGALPAKTAIDLPGASS
jgi:polyprenyl-phospho-N-acetylgalactosaminyl synthase